MPAAVVAVAVGLALVLVLVLAAVGRAEGVAGRRADAGRAAETSPGVPLSRGADPGGVREYNAYRAVSAPVIDGSLDDVAWKAAPWTDSFVDIRGSDAPAPRYRTRAKLLWDDRYLYVGAELQEPRLWATLREHDDTVWHDPDFEVFVDPDGDGLAYFEMEINALGTVLDLFLPKPYRQGGHGVLSWDLKGLRSAVALHGTLDDPSDIDQGWSVELAIPWTGLVPPEGWTPGTATDTEPGAAPRPGDTWRINFSRVEWPLEVVDGAYRKAPVPPGTRHPEDNWVWSPQGAIDMHIPSRWGRVTFREAPKP